MTQPISSSGDIPPHPLFDNPTLAHIFEKIFYYCSERDLKRLAGVNRTLRAVIFGNEDRMRRIVLAALNQRGFHLPEIPLCLRTQLFPPHPTSPRVQELQESLLMITREAVREDAIPKSHNDISPSYRIRQILDAQLCAGDLEGAAATIEKIRDCPDYLVLCPVFTDLISALQAPPPSSNQLSPFCRCTAYARLARAQFLSGDFEEAESTIRKIKSYKFTFYSSLAELAAEMIKDSSQKEKATALFKEAREIPPHYSTNFERLRVLLYIAQLEATSGLNPKESLANAGKIPIDPSKFAETFCAIIHFNLTVYKLTKTPIPVVLNM